MKAKTFAPLSEDFKPPKLLHRDEQLQKMLWSTIESGIPENLWLEGGKGLGKTLTCKCFADEVEARGICKVFFLQCEKSMKRALESMCSIYNLPVSTRGTSPSSVALAAHKIYRDVPILTFIIEEPESASSLPNMGSFVHVLYNTLLNVRGRLRFNICFTSRLLYAVAEREFECEKDSRLGLKPIIFNTYGVPQIIDILKQRLDLMFDDPDQAYEKGALYVIAKHVYRVGGDIREALKITKMAVDLATDKITQDIAEEAVERSKKEWWRNQLANLPGHEAFILYLAAEEALSSQDGTVLQANLVDKYIRRCEAMKVDRLDRRSVYYLLSDLTGKGFYEVERIHAFGHPLRLIFDKSTAKRILEAGESFEWSTMLK